MAEIIALGASIIAVIQISDRIIGLTKYYIEAVHDAPRDLHVIRIEVSTLKAVFESLKLLQDSEYTLSKNLKKLGEKDGAVEGCRRAVLELGKLLDPTPQSTNNGKRRRIQATLSSLAWPFKESKAKKLLDEISRYKITITLSLSAEQACDVKALREYQVASEQQVILDWITPIDYAPQQSDAINRRQAGTGQWLLDSPEFQRWLQTEKQTLFCPGIPGAGKTILTSIVVDELTTRFHNDESIGVAYIYCNFQRQDEQKAEHLIAGLLKQLAQGRHSMPDIVKSLHDKYKDKRSHDKLSKTLQSVAALYSRVFIVVDAIDECQVTGGSRARFLSDIFELQAKCGVNVFATSRFIPEITDKFKDSTSLEIRASKQDVWRYVDGHLSHLPSFVERRPDLQEEIKTQIVKAVDGMFLLAQLHLDSLMGKRSPKAVRAALTRLPSGSEAYDNAYEDAIERIQGQVTDQEELAKQVLSWIVCARRPLTTAELQHALGVEVGELELDEDNLPQIEDMVSVCAGLVTVDEESGIIRLVHYTTQEFFERTQKQWFPNAEDNIAEICVTYLSFHTFKYGVFPVSLEAILPDCDRSRKRKSDAKEYSEKYPFLGYAANDWTTHVRRCSKRAELLASSLQLCDVHSNTFKSWFEVYWMEKWDDCSDWSALMVASNFGLDLVANQLLQAGAGVRAEDNYHRTALLRAAENGHHDIVQLLLSHGAQVTDEDHYRGGKPLYLAARGGHRDIVQLLMHHDADIGDYGSWNHESAVHVAAENGHLEIVRDLLDFYVDVDIWAITSETPLHSAKTREVIKVLVEEYDADVNAMNYSGRTPLHYAIEDGNEELVRFFIGQDAEINTQASFDMLNYEDDEEDYGGTALHCAAVAGNIGVMQILLHHSPDLHIRDVYGRTALHKAAMNGHEATVKLLLESGAKAHSKDNKGLTPLCYAARHGHRMVMELLLATNGVSQESEDIYQGNVLLWAAENGDEAIVQQQLDIGTDIEVKGVGVNDVVRLLDKGADIEASPTKTPLSIAACKGHRKIVHQLLDRGVDIEAKPTSGHDVGQTPLILAADRGHEAIVRLLLNKGAGIEAKPTSADYVGQTPLSFAAKNGHETVIEDLLGSGADINLQDSNC
ncbi:MAG: hypothetical protein M1840_006094 [Geoglossum simile]|nr:MAG: hypothetical protein M1840_006094 [Geoglossum simile]